MDEETQHYWSTDVVNPSPGETINGYTIIDIIKATNFSIVYAGFDISTGEKVVLKFVKRTKGHETLIENELQMQKLLSVESILRIRDDFPYGPFHVIVLPFAMFGSLEEFQSKLYPTGMPESMVQKVVTQMLNALAALDGLEIAHCDIKLDNFLVLDDSPTKPVVKLCDFGLARYIRDGEHATERNGTLQYLAPEMWLKKQCLFLF